MKNDFSLECLSDGQQVYCTAGDRALVTWWMYMVHHFKRLKIPLKGTQFVFPCSVSCLVSTGSIALWASCSELLGGHGLCTFCSCMLQKKAKLTAALDWLGGIGVCIKCVHDGARRGQWPSAPLGTEPIPPLVRAAPLRASSVPGLHTLYICAPFHLFQLLNNKVNISMFYSLNQVFQFHLCISTARVLEYTGDL